MISEMTGVTTGSADEVVMDPFAFFAGTASRINGLGGSEPAKDASYAFHSAYVQCKAGPVCFTLQIKNLKATKGSLVVSINGMSTESGAEARTLKTVVISLRDLAYRDGEHAIRLDAGKHMLYAVLAHVYDATDATASEMDIVLDRREDGTAYAAELADARRTVFGRSAVRAVARLVSTDPATLTDPVSQMCTLSQFDEPAFRQWADTIRQPVRHHRKLWEFVYILQVLKRYGMLRPGARGLGFGVGVEALPAVYASMGCDVVATDLPADDVRAADWNATDQHISDISRLRHPEICPDEVFDSRVSFRPVDMTAIPRDLREFDFCWSSCAYEHLGSIKAGLQFVSDSVRCLKPGGIAVHTTELNLLSNDETVDNAGTVLFRRRDMEQLTLDMISRGHQVAQLKYDQGAHPLDAHVDMPPYSPDTHLKLALGRFVTTSFGIIVRHGA